MKSETLFCRQNTAEDNNAEINLSPTIPCTFLLFKTSAFLQIFFLKNFLIGQVLRMLVFLTGKCLIFFYLKEHPLKTSNKKAHNLLFVNLFV